MIYYVLWILIGLVSYFAGFKLLKTTTTRKEALKGIPWALAGPIVTLLLIYFVLEEHGYLAKLKEWLEKDI